MQRTYIFEEEYRKASREAEKAVNTTTSQRKLILDALQDMDGKRIECFKVGRVLVNVQDNFLVELGYINTTCKAR